MAAASGSSVSTKVRKRLRSAATLLRLRWICDIDHRGKSDPLPVEIRAAQADGGQEKAGITAPSEHVGPAAIVGAPVCRRGIPGDERRAGRRPSGTRFQWRCPTSRPDHSRTSPSAAGIGKQMVSRSETSSPSRQACQTLPKRSSLASSGLFKTMELEMSEKLSTGSANCRIRRDKGRYASGNGVRRGRLPRWDLPSRLLLDKLSRVGGHWQGDAKSLAEIGSDQPENPRGEIVGRQDMPCGPERPGYAHRILNIALWVTLSWSPSWDFCRKLSLRVVSSSLEVCNFSLEAPEFSPEACNSSADLSSSLEASRFSMT